MKMNNLFAVGVCCLLTTGLVYADNDAGTGVGGEAAAMQDADLPFVTGAHWMQSSEVERNAYLYGLGNMVELQQALVDDHQSTRKLNDVLIRGLSPMDLVGVKQALDDWYAAHPADGDRPVLSVLYHEIALPLATRK